MTKKKEKSIKDLEKCLIDKEIKIEKQDERIATLERKQSRHKTNMVILLECAFLTICGFVAIVLACAGLLIGKYIPTAVPFVDGSRLPSIEVCALLFFVIVTIFSIWHFLYKIFQAVEDSWE